MVVLDIPTPCSLQMTLSRSDLVLQTANEGLTNKEVDSTVVDVLRLKMTKRK